MNEAYTPERLSLFDGIPDPGFDSLTEFTSRLIGAPVSLISIIDPENDRQFFTSASDTAAIFGGACETPLSESFCRHVVDRDAALEVEDAKTHPLVTAGMVDPADQIGSYLGLPVRGPDGKPLGALCAIDTVPRRWKASEIEDMQRLAAAVTDRIALRSALIRSEELLCAAESERSAAERLGRIVERSSHEIFVFDVRTLTMKSANAGARQSLGYGEEILAALTPRDIGPAMSNAEFRKMTAPLHSGASTGVQFESVHRRANGEEYPVSMRVELDDDGSGGVYIAYCKDISVRRSLENALEERRRDVERLLGALPDCVTRAAPDTTVLYANTAYASLLGRTQEQIVGTQFLDLIPQETRADLIAHLENLTPDNPVQQIEHPILDATGQYRNFLWSSLMVYEDGVPVELVSVGKDVTLLHDAREAIAERARQAEAANRAKTAFVANMSHEIRTPMNGVLGMASALQTTALSNVQKPMVDVIVSAGRELLELLNNIIDLSKIEAEVETPTAGNFAPGRLLTDVTALFAPKAREKGVELQCAVGTVDETLTGSTGRIRQVVTNLISNAVKFSHGGTVDLRHDVTVDPRSGQAMLTIRVADRGPGVPDAMKTMIFERFQQGDHTAERHLGGAGLGLAISQRLCDLHGGSLHVEDRDGGGAEFVARFAVGLADVGADVIAPETVEPADDGGRLRLLVAEDNPMNRKVLEALLIGQAVDTVFAEDGGAALEMLRSRDFDAALIDIQMPVMSGIGVVQAVRREEAEGDLPAMILIACSANVLNEQVEAYHGAGFDRLLSKPISHTELMECMRWIAEQVTREAVQVA